ncbi:unnamed protein product [Pedinophyceae sp. YPF-701]|nr:unnamed protein product [Pedinophyceae sp. YPF-701]
MREEARRKTHRAVETVRQANVRTYDLSQRFGEEVVREAEEFIERYLKTDAYRIKDGVPLLYLMDTRNAPTLRWRDKLDALVRSPSARALAQDYGAAANAWHDIKVRLFRVVVGRGSIDDPGFFQVVRDAARDGKEVDVEALENTVDIDGLRRDLSADEVSGDGADAHARGVYNAEVEQCLAAMERFRRHLFVWAFQLERHRHHVHTMTHGDCILVIDFKEKLQAEMRVRERQSDRWKNSSVSMLNITILWVDTAGERHTQHVNFLSGLDTKQDAEWVHSAFAQLPTVLREVGLKPDDYTRIKGWSDNGSHFHN